MKAKMTRFMEWFAEMWKAIFVGVVFGTLFGMYLSESKVHADCRIAGAVRIGGSAFKCEQYSRVVLLTPAEQAKKQEKK